MNLLPGVQTNVGQESLGGTYSGVGTTGVNGLPGSALSVNVDGQDAMDLGSAGTYTTYESFDAIDQVQVLLNNYQAEYGRAGGAMVNVVTKSGTNQFHGTIYSYFRNEDLNATDFFNNKQHLPKTKYRYLTDGGAIGGPITIPGLFNVNRQKLFFFYNIEGDPATIPQAATQLTLPTAPERQGNFSKSSIIVKDPSTGTPFPGNIVPSTRINSSTQALLNLFPMPNQLNTAVTNGTYNYAYNQIASSSKLSNVFRVDYSPNEKNMLYFRGSIWDQSLSGYNGTGGMTNWPLFENKLVFPVRSGTLGYTHTFSPTVVNEFDATARRNYLIVPAPDQTGLSKIQRTAVGYTIGQLYPQNNPLDLIPNATFGGVTDSPAFTSFYSGRYPAHRTDTVLGLSDGITINHGSHTFKAGVYYDKVQEISIAGFGTTWVGTFDFGVNANNPGNTNNPFANALLGNFNSYTEPTARVRPSAVAFEADWYVQDSWKVTRRLTLEYGLRAEYDTNYESNNAGQLSEFTMATYNPSQAPLLYQPVLVNGQRQALNPVTGQTGVQALIGAYVTGTGNLQNGLITAANSNFPRSFVNSYGELFQPRFGFAYDVFGNGKTAIRGGFGKFNELNRVEVTSANPPISYNTTILDGNVGSFLSTPGVSFPVPVTGWQQNMRAPNVYQGSFGIQQDLGFNTVLDVKYVGTLARNLLVTENIDELPYGTRFRPTSQDPTTGKPLPDSFLVPLPQYTSITEYVTPATSNYNALQITANRRFTQNLQFGVSYSFSKMTDYGSTWPTYADPKVWAYGLSSQDQTNVFVINYTYNLPGLSRVWPNAFTRGLLDHWSLSGVSTFSSGLPLGVTFTTTNGEDLLGGGDTQRLNETCNPNLSHGDRSVLHMFDTSCFALPALGSPGNAPRTVFRGPGFNQWDMTLFKEFPLNSEKRTLQFRWEAYNLFNHTQFSSVNTSAQFTPAGVQVNGQLGQATGDRNPRIMQLGLRLRF